MGNLAAKKVQGVVLQVEIATVFTTIPGLTNIKAGGLSVDERETTDLASTIKEYDPMLPSASTVTAEGKLDGSNVVHQHLIAAMTADPPTKENYKIVYPDASEDTFEAFVKVYEPDAMTSGGHRSAKWEFRPTGAYTTPT